MNNRQHISGKYQSISFVLLEKKAELTQMKKPW
jgi:hypothetical protein